MQRFVDSSAAIIERYTAVDDIQGGYVGFRGDTSADSAYEPKAALPVGARLTLSGRHA